MAKKLPSVDALMIGFGWTGAIMAQELTDAGLNVLALERGAWADTSREFATTFAQDELRYFWRHDLFQTTAHDTQTIRNDASQVALPMRKLGSYLPGTNVGGAGVHWNGQTWRFLPSDFIARSHNLQRYGAAAVPDTMTIQDWGVTYDDLELHYDRFERLCGISGKAGNLRGQIQPGGNPFEGARSSEYPNPPMAMSYPPTLFADAAKGMGLHPFPQPSANMSQAYVNPLGVRLEACTYCGFCEKFACGNYSKASAQTTILPVLMKKPNFKLRTECEVTKINLDSSGKRAVSVTYVDAAGEEYEQPADLIVLCSYILNNVRLLLLSGIGAPYDPQTGQGVIGKNYAYQITSSVNLFFDDKILNPFIGAGAHGMLVDEWNGDNFDHAGLGFIGGGFVGVVQTGARPIETHPVPEGTPNWGGAFKKAIAANYLKTMSIATHGAVMSHRGNYLDLDPTYRDVYGRPLLRMTFDYTDNEHRMSDYLTDRATDVARAMKAREIKINKRKGSWDVVPYQTTHNTGGAIMGSDPQTSAVNRYLQSWDVSNLFVMGASAFPQNPGYNPTGTVAALAYASAEAITQRYLKAPALWPEEGRAMRTHPLIALLVVAAAITTMTVFGQSAPVQAQPAARKPHHADAALDAHPTVPAWLVAPAASAASSAAVAASSAGIQRPADTASLIERGRYLAAAGDCAGCHTTESGAPYAGGRPLETPFGTVLSANLTPDASGLKSWNADQFWRAMHDGISANGDHLYPAFPYNYFAHMPRADTDALFAYLQSLPPVVNKPDRNQLPFPFNIRALVSVWNALYLDKTTFATDASHNAQWNRGAYLVEGPGHCAACHTSKTVLGGPQKGRDFQGGAFGTWFAPDLTPNGRTGLGGWTRDETVAFLKTGRNAHASALGEMGLVVQDSTSNLADDDLQAIAAYLADRAAAPAVSMTPPDTTVMKAGEAIFVDECASCHLMRGQGQTLAFPPLAHSANAQQTDPTTALHLILAGAQASPTRAAPTAFTMPAFAWKLDDKQVAAVATFVRNSWGNAAPEVAPDQVAKLRNKLSFDATATGHTPATPLTRPGPNTLGVHDTDSRDNGGAQAGRAAPAGGPAASAGLAASGA